MKVTERVGMGNGAHFPDHRNIFRIVGAGKHSHRVESAQGLRQRFWLNHRHKTEVNRGIDEALTQVGLTGKADRLVGELSHGDQRAAEIATALSLKPRLLLSG
jgi:branched-chain amino acid transport system ATP-binding protein